jgi:hypothetical protein
MCYNKKRGGMIMKFNKLSLGFGIAFGVTMLALTYLNIVLGIVLAFLGVDTGVLVFLYPILGVATIIASILTLKNVWVARIVNLISALAVLATVVLYGVVGLLSKAFILVLLYIISFVIGLISVIFAWKAKNKAKVETKTE